MLAVLLMGACATKVGALERQVTEQQARIEALEVRQAELMSQFDEMAQRRRPRDRGSSGVTGGPVCEQRVDGTYVAPRSSDELFSRSARIVPQMQDGTFEGFKMFAIRTNSLADRCGFMNGDLVHSVAGRSLDSVDTAMEAFNAARDAESFDVELVRRGRPITLHFEWAETP